MVVVALLVVAQVVALVVVESVAVLVQRRRSAVLPRRLLALPRPQHFLLESYPFSNPGHDAGHAGRLCLVGAMRAAQPRVLGGVSVRGTHRPADRPTAACHGPRHGARHGPCDRPAPG